MKVFDQGLELAPNHHGLWHGRGNALIGLERFDDALQAYDRGLAIAADDFFLWLTKGWLLARHPEVKRKTEDITAQRCIYRAIAVTEGCQRLGTKPSIILIELLLDYLDSPLLLHRLVLQYPNIGTLVSRRAALEANDRRLAPVHSVLDWLQSDECALPKTERLLLRRRIELHFGDPPAALLTLDELDDLDPANLTGQLYLTWAMQECLSDLSAQITVGAERAREALVDPEAPARTCFDAGHLLLLSDEIPDAAAAFDRAAKSFVPARIMACYCRQRLGDRSAAEAHMHFLLEEEKRRFSRGIRGFLVPIDPPEVDPATPQVSKALEEVFERFECAEALEAWCLDGTLEANPTYQFMVERLGGGLDEWMAEYDRRLGLWGDLYGQRDRLKQARLSRSQTWINSERVRLRAALEWLGTETGGLRDQVLVERIADRIYEAPALLDSRLIIDAIQLLFVEHLLPADFAMLLILYVACRAAELQAHEGRHAQLTAKHGIAAFVGTMLFFLGFEHALTILATTTGVGLVGDVLADHVGAWLDRRRTAGDPFPRFARFREELLEYCEKYGRPISRIIGP